MAVAPLSKVTLAASRNDLGILLAELIKFGTFHPIKEKGMTQDVGILLIASRAQDVFGRAGELLRQGGFGKEGRPKEVERFEAHDVQGLVSSLDDYVRIVEEDASLFSKEEDKTGVVSVLVAVQEAALMVFDDLQRILVFPGEAGAVSLKGFVPTKSVEKLRALMGAFLKSVEPVKPAKPGKDDPYIPSLLVNPRVVSFFQNLTLMRGLPRYGEVDPTPILAFVFPFFFGLMFGDIGHGVALLAFGLYLIYRTSYAAWGKQVLVLSLSTTIVGFVRGAVFGLTFTSPLSRVVALPPAFSATFTLSYIPFLLELAVVIGTFHLASAYVISFINNERVGNNVDAFLNKLPTAFLYVFIVPLGFAVAGTGLDFGVLFTSSAPTPVFNQLLGLDIPIGETARFSLPFVVAASVVLVISHPVETYLDLHRLGATLKAVPIGAFDTAAKYFEFFTNTLSYVRLGVLLVTTTLLETLTADVLRAGPVGIAVGAFLNVCVISLEGLVIYIQDMRLQLYEWFSQFYAGTGVPFMPLVSSGVHFTVSWT